MSIPARFSGACPDCGERWQPGDLIRAASQQHQEDLMNTTPKTPFAIPTGPDERIAAWEAIAAHPAFRPGFAGDGPVLPRMLAKLDEWASLPQTAPTVDPEDLRPGDRFRAVYEYRVDHLGDWQPVAENRYELLGHDDDPRVAVVREWLSVVPLSSAAGDEGLARDLIAKLDAVRLRGEYGYVVGLDADA